MKLLFTSLSVILAFSCFAQYDYRLPKDYKKYRLRDDLPFDEPIRYDFDNDGILDQFGIYEKGDGVALGVLFLSSTYAGSKKFSYLILDHDFGYHLAVKNGVLEIFSGHSRGKYSKLFKFRYSRDFNDLRLIGYDEEETGNAAHWGAYTKSVNLLTGYYEIVDSRTQKKIRKRTQIDAITVSNSTENTVEYLDRIGSEHMPK